MVGRIRRRGSNWREEGEEVRGWQRSRRGKKRAKEGGWMWLRGRSCSVLNIAGGLLMLGQEWNLGRAQGSGKARCQSGDMCSDMTLSEGIASATPGPVRVGCVANKSGGDMRLMFWVSQCHASSGNARPLDGKRTQRQRRHLTNCAPRGALIGLDLGRLGVEDGPGCAIIMWTRTATDAEFECATGLIGNLLGTAPPSPDFGRLVGAPRVRAHRRGPNALTWHGPIFAVSSRPCFLMPPHLREPIPPTPLARPRLPNSLRIFARGLRGPNAAPRHIPYISASHPDQ
ncbi:hypothetical protein L227DRAFT_215991 [Lentinus tigrinus ALCF2SS1-6]|uniref:Uncharacterized protein n=1 Tax=Lentinus tigrinus ALCF2SS1-6 TaxID=1328759 RepID=A0A5C2SQH5_9APHY|nr:hypothetical protein L227DRAFT_215991 [Lentinus tigrinus ALCF2SS1-6]